MPRVYAGPTISDGVLVRAVTDEIDVWSEKWNGSAWVLGTGISLAEVLEGLPASKAKLEAAGLTADGAPNPSKAELGQRTLGGPSGS